MRTIFGLALGFGALIAASLSEPAGAQESGLAMPANCQQNLNKCSLQVWPKNSFPHRGVTQSVTFSNGQTLTCTSNGANTLRSCNLSGSPSGTRVGDDQVRDVQKALGDLGYNPGPQDGKLSELTENAIRAYQRDNGLPMTGEMDELTLSRLGLNGGADNENGPVSDQVRGLQQALRDNGYDPGPLDGRLSLRTQNAIRAYEQANGLPMDGKMDELVLRKLGLGEPGESPAANNTNDEIGAVSDQVRGLQSALSARGYDPGPADGRLSTRTVNAIRQFERDHGLPMDGKMDELVLRQLGLGQ